jgi:predicted secreted hydrolase
MRHLLTGLVMASLGAAPPPSYPVVRPGIHLAFPADHGAHPHFRTEWWYVTGWLRGEDGRDIGFQITFFRVNPHFDIGNSSRFSPQQILFAHAALSDSAIGHILHDEKAARGGFGLAEASTKDADIRLLGWRLRRLPDGTWASKVSSPGFDLDLSLRPNQPPLLEGVEGYSRKGPKPEQASYYYSLPHLQVQGLMRRGASSERVKGEAWLDREWSSDYLAPGAVGWDWTGLNFDDGSALMAFRIRRKKGGSIWAGGSYRRPDGRIVRLGPNDIRFVPLSIWHSPHTGATYPIRQRLSITIQGAKREVVLEPIFADQEVDARRGGQPVYWEGAVRTRGGHGYLELTGYAADLRM